MAAAVNLDADLKRTMDDIFALAALVCGIPSVAFILAGSTANLFHIKSEAYDVCVYGVFSQQRAAYDCPSGWAQPVLKGASCRFRN